MWNKRKASSEPQSQSAPAQTSASASGQSAGEQKQPAPAPNNIDMAAPALKTGSQDPSASTSPSQTPQSGLDKSAFTEPTPGPRQRTVSEILGEIVWLFSQSPRHKSFFISDLEWLVMTPLLMQQFRIFYAPDKPIGVALWARVSPHVEERLSQGNARLAPTDWKSGEALWLVDIVAPFGGQDEMLKDLKANVFPQEEIKFVVVKEGKLVVGRV